MVGMYLCRIYHASLSHTNSNHWDGQGLGKMLSLSKGKTLKASDFKT